MLSYCSIHPDCYLKYFCIEALCDKESRLACAECQIEGPHLKHEFNTINSLKKSIQNSCQKTLLSIQKGKEKNSITQKIREEFEYIRLFAIEALEKVQEACIQLAQNQLNGSQKRIEEQNRERLNEILLQSEEDSNQLLEKQDHSFLLKLYTEKEKVFAQEDTCGILNKIKQNKSMLFNFIDSWKKKFIQNEKEHIKKPASDKKGSQEILLSQGKIFDQNALNENDDVAALEQNKNVDKSEESISIHSISAIDSEDLHNQNNPLSKYDFKISEFKRIASKTIVLNHSIILLREFDETRILTASSDNVIRICNKSTMEVQKEFKGHNWNISGISPLTQNRFILSSSADTSLKLWRVFDMQIVKSTRPHQFYEITSLLLFLEDSILTAGKDCSIILHKVTNTKSNDQKNDDISNEALEIHIEHTIKDLNFPIRLLEKINDDIFAAGLFSGDIHLFNFISKEQILFYESAHPLGLYSLTKVDSEHFCSSGGDKKVKIWSIFDNSEAVSTYEVKESEVQVKNLTTLKENSMIACTFSNQIIILSVHQSSFINKDQRSLSIQQPYEVSQLYLLQSNTLAAATSKQELIQFI